MSRRNPSMDAERVRRLLEQYGGDPARFPEPERALAERLLATDPRLRRLQQEAQTLDALLDASTTASPSANLRRQVVEIPLRHPQGPGWNLLLLLENPQALLRMAMVIAITAVLGMASGLSTRPVPGDGQESDAESASWDELASLAFGDDLTLNGNGVDDPWETL